MRIKNIIFLIWLLTGAGWSICVSTGLGTTGVSTGLGTTGVSTILGATGVSTPVGVFSCPRPRGVSGGVRRCVLTKTWEVSNVNWLCDLLAEIESSRSRLRIFEREAVLIEGDIERGRPACKIINY